MRYYVAFTPGSPFYSVEEVSGKYWFYSNLDFDECVFWIMGHCNEMLT